MIHQQEIIPHLFRTEYRKIVSVLCRRFGMDGIETAEDIASDTFAAAAQVWALKGIPPNPAAWLYTVAKNKAKNHFKRNSIYNDKVIPGLSGSIQEYDLEEIDLSPHNINDSQLQMMLAVCHPSIPVEAQIALSLRILCGFGIEEIADAFLTNKETINKRLHRAKEKLRAEKIKIEVPSPEEITTRLETVLRTIYLLFNEGYYSVSNNQTLRKDLCLEAIRLCHLLVENQDTNTPEANALLSLMCFHSSRFNARFDNNGDIILYDDQDTSLWDSDLISRGIYFLNCAASGTRLSKYHLEAGIAYWHTKKEDTKEKWENILRLYNHLLQMEYSPVAALNRTYVLSKTNSKEEAITEAEKLKLTGNHFYYILLAELYTGLNTEKAIFNFNTALSLAKTETDKKAIMKKLNRLDHEPGNDK